MGGGPSGSPTACLSDRLIRLIWVCGFRHYKSLDWSGVVRKHLCWISPFGNTHDLRSWIVNEDI